jgi:prepilin-type N-terminal cleavage/methylation domain-containing protein
MATCATHGGTRPDPKDRLNRTIRQTTNQRTFGGVTLTELLVTMALLALLAAIAIPGWVSFAGTQSRRSATGLVLGSLERARVAAVTGKKQIWVVLRHSEGKRRDSLRILSGEASGFSPIGPWLNLPAGMRFLCDGGALPDIPPPTAVLADAGDGEKADGGTTANGERYGGLMFRTDGAVGLPKQGDSRLLIPFSAEKGPPPASITVSRGTGRAATGS